MALALSVAGCAGQDMTADQPDEEEIREGEAEVKQTIAMFVKTDPSMKQFMDSAYGYAIFPSVTKGGLIVGGTVGDGWVYERGRLVGEAELQKVSVGAQAGGENYSEIIFFKDQNAMNTFKQGDFELGADLNAVVNKQDAAARAGYTKGIAVFVMSKGGLMAEASVGGQKLNFSPITPRQ